MKKPTVSRPANRIAGLVHRPGGMTADEAISAATANLESIRERTLGELAGILTQMRELAQGLPPRPDRAAVQPLYALSNSVIGIAGAFGLNGLSDVAFSLCELIDRLVRAAVWDADSVRVHLDSMAAMQAAEPGEQDGQAVRQALRLLVERIPVVSG